MLFFRLLVFSFLLVACSVKEPSSHKLNSEINKLEILVDSLSPKVNSFEAKSLALNSVHYSLKLAQKYETISSPWIQNTLVNMGIKERGLCYEWSEDLLIYLLRQKYETLEFHAIGANIGYLNEHNALAVSAKGEGIKNSIILDAWRHSGKLYFEKINKDLEYKWEERVGLYGVLPPR